LEQLEIEESVSKPMKIGESGSERLEIQETVSERMVVRAAKREPTVAMLVRELVTVSAAEQTKSENRKMGESGDSMRVDVWRFLKPEGSAGHSSRKRRVEIRPT
jgi:hypothetical protein